MRLFTAVFTLVPLSVFAYFSVTHETKLNWTGPLWLAMLPLMSWSMTSLKFQAQNNSRFLNSLYKLWQPTLLVTLMIMGGMMHYLVLGLPGIGYNPQMRLPVAWEEIGTLVEAVEEQVEAQIHEEPLVVGVDKYFTASQVAFYRNKIKDFEEEEHQADFDDYNEGILHTTADHLFGRTGLMYRYWFPHREQIGRTMLLVSRSEDHLSDQKMEPYFESLSPVKQATVKKHQQQVGCFYYRVGYRYHQENIAMDDTLNR